MDIQLKKRPWYIRYKYHIAGGSTFIAFLVYVIILSAGPRRLRIDPENIQMAEVLEGKFRCGRTYPAHPYHQNQYP